MAYNRTFWVDHVVDQNGNVIQNGTLVDQDHLNNQEVGIFNNNSLIDEMLRILLLNDPRIDSLEGRSTVSEDNIAALTKKEDEDNRNARDTSAELLRSILLHDTEIDALKGEVITKTLTNSQEYPFNNSKTTIQLSSPRVNSDYTVDIQVDSVEGGAVGDFYITDKLINGFKLEYTGSATSVAVTLHIRGGI